MISLPMPPFAAIDTYAACAQGVRDSDLKARLAGDTWCVAGADARYAQAGAANTTDDLTAADFQMSAVTPAEMRWLYDRRLAGKTTPARATYDWLKQSAPFGRCALCGVRDATTLDHYLPKSTFPSLAVNPVNLMPACAHCNQLKSSRIGTTVHAYFDDVSSGAWLAASIVESKPCAVLFDAISPGHWPIALADRVRVHFAVLRLGALYSLQASRTLRGDAVAFRRAFKSDGPKGVRINVNERAASWTDHDPNCWEAAMYTAMSQSDWFCDGGFELD
jgi:hypothetical protein